MLSHNPETNTRSGLRLAAIGNHIYSFRITNLQNPTSVPLKPPTA